MRPFSGDSNFDKTNTEAANDILGHSIASNQTNAIIGAIETAMKKVGPTAEWQLEAAKLLATVDPRFAQFAGVDPNNIEARQKAEALFSQLNKSIFENTKNLRSTIEFNALTAQYGANPMTQPGARDAVLSFLRNENNARIVEARDLDYAMNSGFFQRGQFRDVRDFEVNWVQTHDAFGRAKIGSIEEAQAMEAHGLLAPGDEVIVNGKIMRTK